MVRQKVLYARLHKAVERAQQMNLEEKDTTIQNQHAQELDSEGMWYVVCNTKTGFLKSCLGMVQYFQRILKS